MREPLVYIILVNYNGYKDTIECIKSLNEIEYENYKIIVVDNNSKDKSVEQIKKACKNIHLIESKENLGFSGGNNLGTELALEENAEFVLLLNNDTTVEKDFLKCVVEESVKDKSVGISTGKILYYYDKDRIWYAGGEILKRKGDSMHHGFNELYNDKRFDFKKYITFSTGCFMLIKSKAINKVGMMPEEYFLYYEDTDYSAKFSNAGFNILYCPNSIIYHKVSAATGNMSSLSQYYFARNRLMFIKQNISKRYKLLNHISFYLDLLKNIVRKRGKFNNYFKGCRDFYRGICGPVKLEK